MGNFAFGTSYFVNIKSAITYYRNMGLSEADVRDKLIEGEIHIGKPEAWAGHYLKVDEDGRFQYVQIEEDSIASIQAEQLSRDVADARIRTEQLSRDVADALRDANKAMDKRTNKILDWIYAAREVMLIINAIMLFGIVCYLLFLGV